MTMRYALAAALILIAPAASAQTLQPKLIRKAEFGTVREVEGAQVMIAVARDGCPLTAQPTGGGPCFDTVMKRLTATPQRVLGLYRPAVKGERVAGRYGGDYALFDARLDGQTLVVERRDLPTSDVTVPRNCFRLNGEGVGYVIANEGGNDVAYESQLVVCDGGADTPAGPYRPEGPPITPSGNVWHKTEKLQVWGRTRYLATTGEPCPAGFTLRKTWCAPTAIAYLQANPQVKDIDLIAARQPVSDGEILSGKQVDQWVLKRSGKSKFRADSRWVDKSFMDGAADCVAAESIGWHVRVNASERSITEGAVHECGAPLAPVPADIYEAYGDDYFIVDCAERRGEWRKNAEGSCMEQARDHLVRIGSRNATVVVMNERGRVDDQLFPGSYLSYDVASVSLNKQDVLEVNVYNHTPSVSMANCRPMVGGPNESQGFILVRSLGVTRAREYQWMACPVY